MDLSDKITTIAGVGAIISNKLERLGIRSIFDLLYHLPFRYEDRSVVTPTTQARVGETITLSGILSPVKNFVTKSGRRMQIATLTDANGQLNIAWFNQVYLSKTFSKPTEITVYGKIEFFGTKPTMFSPQYEFGKNIGIVSIYHETAGLTSKFLRSKIKDLLALIPEQLIPDQPEWRQALQTIHFPKKMTDIEPARQKLAFVELVMLHIASLRRKLAWDQSHQSQILTISSQTLNTFLAKLLFKLTLSQQKAVSEVLVDLQKPISMNRLLLGDVGSGKTIVAAVAAFVAEQNGYQTLLLAPTQILAEQHKATFKNLGVDAIIGTHALLFKDFEKVGLVIIDEQHRFGVEQRKALVAKGDSPHILTMTATPIPRTIALTKYADLDISVLSEKPSGRQIIKTWVVPEEKRLASYTWIKKQQGQIFWVCPLIEESETLASVKSVKSEFESLQKIFTSHTLGLLHGKMKLEDKNKRIQEFKDKKIDILVSTPVVEVGVDIPGASIMVIEAAERFGLASLHQLRGRVGRNKTQAYCLLFANSGIERLKNLETLDSGLELAEVDFRTRGPGQMAGNAQHGESDFKIAGYSDLVHLQSAKTAAFKALSQLADWPTLRLLTNPGKIEATN